MPEPIFQKEGIFTVVLFRPEIVSRPTTRKMSEKMSEKILLLVTENNLVTTQQLAELLGKSTRTIERHIKALKKQGRIERVGPDKGGHWKVMSQ